MRRNDEAQPVGSKRMIGKPEIRPFLTLWGSFPSDGKIGLYSGPQVLVLYRKRERARRTHEHGVFARFRYNDLKEAARGCGGRGPYANSNGGKEQRRTAPRLCGRARRVTV